MKTPIEVPYDLFLFIVGSIFLYLGIRENKKYKEKKKKASKFNEFGFIEDKWSYFDYQGYRYIITFFMFGISCILAVIIHLLDKYLS